MTAMPGARMLAIAQAWCSPDTVARVFEPLIADYQADGASRQGIHRLRCTLAGVACFVVSFALTFGRDLRRPLPQGLTGRSSLTFMVFVALGMTVQFATMFDDFVQSGANTSLIFPAFLGLALPLALVPATILVATDPRWPAHAVRRAIACGAAALVTTLIVLNGWVVPNFNQRLRVATAAHYGQPPVARGNRELSLRELAATAAPSDAVSAPRRPSRRYELHARLGLMFSPIPIAALGLAVARCRRYALRRAILWWTVCALVLMFGSMTVDPWSARLGAPPISGWLPHVILILLTVAIHATSRRDTVPPRAPASGPTAKELSGPTP